MRHDPIKLIKRRELRQAMSPPEQAMWKMLRAHRLNGWKFTRQVEVGPYFIDFAARQQRLAIELDGETHAGREPYDARRTEYLESRGWRVIRFTNGELLANPEGVAITIASAIGAPPLPDPLPAGERA